MWRIGRLLIGLLLLTGCARMDDMTTVTVAAPNQTEEVPTLSYTETNTGVEMTEVEGEAISPNGRYQVLLTETASEETYAPKNVIVWDTVEHLIKWQDTGYLDQSALWSFEGRYLALAQSARTYERITIIETDTWTEWEFTLPDGSAIPEYTFLPEEWGAWTEEDVLRLVIGRGGDAGTQSAYRCTLQMKDGKLSGSTALAAEILTEDYDFNHNGILETVTLEGNAGEESSFWVLRVTEDEKELWADSAALSHAGWNSILACRIDGQDYLMRYMPGMWQGFATYDYKAFSLGEIGEEVVFRENRVEFDNNFGSSMHQNFDVEAIAGFLWEVREQMMDSTLLLSTEDGTFQSGGHGFHLTYYPFGGLVALDSREAVEDALRLYELEEKQEQGVA